MTFPSKAISERVPKLLYYMSLKIISLELLTHAPGAYGYNVSTKSYSFGGTSPLVSLSRGNISTKYYEYVIILAIDTDAVQFAAIISKYSPAC